MQSRRFLCWCALLAALHGCTNATSGDSNDGHIENVIDAGARDAAGSTDGSVMPDAGRLDAALADAHEPVDAATGLDAGHGDAGTDASTEPDAATPEDAGLAVDGSSAHDAGDASVPPSDAGSLDDAAVVADASANEAGAGPGDAGEATDGSSEPDGGHATRVRVMAANLTSGSYQTYDGAPAGGPAGIRIMQGLRPDIILIQEFNYDPNGDRYYAPEETRLLVDAVCGVECWFERENGTGGADIPNGVISRFPILMGGEWDDPLQTNRDFVYALIDLPGPRDLWAVSLHLSTDENKRPASMSALAGFIAENVPPTDLLVVVGDLNTDTAIEPGLDVLDVALETLVFPVDEDGASGTNASRDKPYDRVMPDDDFEALRVPVVIGANSFPDGLVFDSRVYSALDDVTPVQTTDSGEPAMQHMAVLKDFLVRW